MAWTKRKERAKERARASQWVCQDQSFWRHVLAREELGELGVEGDVVGRGSKRQRRNVITKGATTVTTKSVAVVIFSCST